MSENESLLNPSVRTTTIGVRTMREIKIYPLSIGEQKNLTDLIMEGLSLFQQVKDPETDTSSGLMIIGMIVDNITKILGHVTDEGEGVINDVTNDQAMEIAELVYEMNYGGIKKKFQEFMKRIKVTKEKMENTQ